MDKFDVRGYHWMQYASMKGTRLKDNKGNSYTLKRGDLFGIHQLNNNTDYVLIQNLPTVIFRLPLARTDAILGVSKKSKVRVTQASLKPKVVKSPITVKSPRKPSAPKSEKVKIVLKPPIKKSKIKVQFSPKAKKFADQDDMLGELNDTKPDIWGSHRVEAPDEWEADEEIPEDLKHSYHESQSRSKK